MSDSSTNKKESVHSRHCCVKHGCKYGEEDCPVWLGYEEQSHPCETCMWYSEEPIYNIPTVSEEELNNRRNSIEDYWS